jgi:galactose mutarotase-like enzyme
LGIWTKKDAPFICIEPWNGYADSDNSNGNLYEKAGIIILDSEQIYTAEFSITI